MTALLGFQVTVDCDDPHAQARFWAAALGYEVEIGTEFIRGLLDAGQVTEDDVLEHDGELFWRIGSAIRHPDAAADPDPATARRPGQRVLFLRVDDRGRGKNSWHLDLASEDGRLDDEVARLTALGAEERYRIAEHGQRHVTMADPEGNLFCVQ